MSLYLLQFVSGRPSSNVITVPSEEEGEGEGQGEAIQSNQLKTTFITHLTLRRLMINCTIIFP